MFDMTGKQFTKRVESIENADGTFCPPEDIDRVEDLFIIRERDGRTVERQLGIRRSRFEKALRHAINRYRDPNGPKPMARAVSAAGGLSLVSSRRTA
jgi:hypothetical protein